MTAVSPKRRYRIVFSATLAALILLLLISVNVGKVSVTFADIIKISLSKLGLASGFSEDVELQKMTVFYNVRMPRSLLAVLVGAALSASGAVMQGLYRNPLAAPDVLGVTQAANFGVGVAIFFFSAGTLGVQMTSFAFGVGVLLFTFTLITRLNSPNITTLVLIGVIMSALFQAGLTLLLYLSDPYSQMLRINYWLLGAFNTASWDDIIIVSPIVIAGLCLLSLFSWRLNVMAQGDEEAMAMGVNVRLWRTFYIIIVALIVSVSTSSVGNISWVGLIIPHIARYIVGSNQARVVPYCTVLGGLFLLLIDTIVRNLSCGEIPISIITSFIAAPFLLSLVMSRDRKRVW